MREESPVDVLKMALGAGADETDRVHLGFLRVALVGQLAGVGDGKVGELDDASALFASRRQVRRVPRLPLPTCGSSTRNQVGNNRTSTPGALASWRSSSNIGG